MRPHRNVRMIPSFSCLPACFIPLTKPSPPSQVPPDMDDEDGGDINTDGPTPSVTQDQESLESPCRYKHLLPDNDDEITSSWTRTLQPHLYVETDASSMPLLGIESALGNKVLRWFMDDREDKTLKFVSMVGPVGVGKTAIAMEIYHRLQNRGGEDGNLLCSATAKVSRRPDMKKVLLHILSQINKPAAAALALASIDKLELLVHNISQCLQDSRYVIVIDDIWEESDWDIMVDAFPQNSRGSRVVITTRKGSIARRCSNFYNNGLVHEVKSLDELDSKNLLLRKAFGCEINYPPENFKQVCGEILRRCEGIPLFINGMANWLQEQRQKVKHIPNYSMEEVPQLLNSMERACSSSYDDLSYQLKVLLLYMSMFPEGYLFQNDVFYRLKCEEFTGYPSTLSMLDIRMDFVELLDRNLFTEVANWKGNHQLKESSFPFKLHYFMLQFLVSKSADKRFDCTNGSLSLVGRSKCTKKLRWISLHRPDPDLEIFLNTRDFSHTRSLAISGKIDGVPLQKFIDLTVLDLEGWQHLKNEHLSLICNAEMLKYLSLRNTRVSRLPPEIKKLFGLRKLVASHTQISELPSEVCKLVYLEVLDLRSTKIRLLPEHIWKLMWLDTLLVGGEGVNSNPTIIEAPEGANFKLSILETVDLGECSAGLVEALGFLQHLKELCISWSFRQCNDARLEEALCSCIQRWLGLQSLTIHCGLGYPMEFLASLHNPFQNGYFTKFCVTGGRFVSIPQWFRGLKDLRSIEITVCRLEQEDLEILANLPSLKFLSLSLHFVPEQEIVVDGVGFTFLRTLSLCCRVPWLTFSEGAMRYLPYLELKIGGGSRSEGRIPSGLENLTSLRELALHYNAWYINDSNVRTIVDAVTKGVANHKHHSLITLVINGNEYQEEYVQVSGDGVGVAIIRCIQDKNDKLQEAEEDASRATGSESKIEIVDAPKLYHQSTASLGSRWYPEDGH